MTLDIFLWVCLPLYILHSVFFIYFLCYLLLCLYVLPNLISFYYRSLWLLWLCTKIQASIYPRLHCGQICDLQTCSPLPFIPFILFLSIFHGADTANFKKIYNFKFSFCMDQAFVFKSKNLFYNPST